MSITTELLTKILEAALMAANKPLSIQHLQQLFDADELPNRASIQEVLGIITDSCNERGFELVEVASGWRFQVRQNLASWIGKLWQEKPQKYSRATLETLALIAYRQPITRGEIEEVRGVAVSSQIMRSLQERSWVKVIGHRDVPGRPAMYATTREFLDYFGIKSLENLPTLAEIRDLDSLSQEFDRKMAEVNQSNDNSPSASGQNESAHTSGEGDEQEQVEALEMNAPESAETSQSANHEDDLLCVAEQEALKESESGESPLMDADSEEAESPIFVDLPEENLSIVEPETPALMPAHDEPLNDAVEDNADDFVSKPTVSQSSSSVAGEDEA